MVEAMIEELREKMAIDLCPEPIVDRWPALAANASAATGSCYLLVGSSHTSKVGAALQQAGHVVKVIYQPNWRAGLARGAMFQN
jgi:CTP:molybdopterin cytidylyltransferase MocA